MPSKLRITRLLLAIPLAVFFIAALAFVVAMLLPVEWALQNTLMLFSLMSTCIAPFICLPISVVGTILARSCQKQGLLDDNRRLIVGIVEIVASLGFSLLALFMIGAALVV